MKFKRSLISALVSVSMFFGGAALAQDLPVPGVRIMPGSQINLVSSQSRFPIRVLNEYDSEVKVLVWVHPTVLWLTAPEAVEVTIPPHTAVNAKIPVTAVANGNAIVEVHLTSFTGVPIGKTEYVHFHVERDFEPVIVIGFIVVVAALGAVGVQRTLRRRRVAA